MSTQIIIGIVLVACAAAAYNYFRRLRRGDNCCSDGEKPMKRVRIVDKDKSHYPHETTLSIDGMTCANCALRVENALHGLPGIWAQVDLGKRMAKVRGKSPIDFDSLRQTVRQAGYSVISAEQEER
ncbi:heavy-metal-associated domain-containing protein [Oscillospiraceae bacterium OttesenSCG-928-F05]|nr:heavy-metal-associated domain-containing protein [Oscillospiraceae bacterium OttesenSCG-928-F05]